MENCGQERSLIETKCEDDGHLPFIYICLGLDSKHTRAKT